MSRAAEGQQGGVADAKASAAAEAAKRGALSDKFQSGSQGLGSHAADREASLKENEELRQHLRKLIERGDLQEAHLRKAKETFDLEKQLMEAQLAEAAERRAAADALRDALEQQLAARGEREGALTEQLAGYSTKFAEFRAPVTRRATRRSPRSRARARRRWPRRARRRRARAEGARQRLALIEMLDEKKDERGGG